MTLFDYDYTLTAGDNVFLEDIINAETYQRLFSHKYISFLNKGICGNGGTTGFVKYALDNDKGCLILVPNRSIVISKEEEYRGNREVCCVYGGSGDIDKDARIVIATYDQFPRLLSALSFGGFTQTDDPWESKFWSGRTIILDEYHKLVDESGFRDTCHKVTELIKNTDCGVVLMSATPHRGYIDFIKELIDKRDIITYNISYDQLPQQLIQVYDTRKRDLVSILKKVKDNNQGEHICVFFNNVKGIKEIIDHLGGEDCEVLCSVSNEKELGDYFSKVFNEKKQLHFLTSAYFTGQDIRHPVKHCIIVGSRESDNMCLGERDIKQIIGRFREGVARIHIFYLSAKPQMDKYQPIRDVFDKNTQLLDVIGAAWTTKAASIHLKQDTIRLRDTLERFDYWSSKKSIIKRLADYGYVVKDKKIGDFENVGKKEKLTFKQAQSLIADGQHITYDDCKYVAHIQEYMNEKGVEEMLSANRTTILDWYKLRKSVGISNLDLLSPEEKFKALGLEHFGRYRAAYLLSCLKFLGVSCDYDQISAKMRENLDCYATRWKAHPKGKAAGDTFIVFKKLKSWGSHKDKSNMQSPEPGNIPHFLSYQTQIKEGKCYAKAISLKEAPGKYQSLKTNPLYEWVCEDKAQRLPDVKGGKEWDNLKKYRQTKISEMYRITDDEYRFEKSSMEFIDCLIIDIDNGITYNEFKCRYGNYVWVAYPTINNIPDDWNRFRVIIPLQHRLKLVGEYNVMTLKMLRALFCYYEDPNHQVTSFVNFEDWKVCRKNDGEFFDIPQDVVDDIMISIKNSKELVIMSFNQDQAAQNINGYHRSKKTLDWAKDFFKASFELGDGERHKRLFVIKNCLDGKSRDQFQSWLMSEYPPRYLEKWKSHKVMNRQ